MANKNVFRDCIYHPVSTSDVPSDICEKATCRLICDTYRERTYEFNKLYDDDVMNIFGNIDAKYKTAL